MWHQQYEQVLPACLLVHHLLKFLEIDATVAVSIDGLDHLQTIRKRTLDTQRLHHLMQLLGGDPTVPIEIAGFESVHQLLLTVPAFDEVREFLHVNKTVAIGVHLLHHLFDLIGRDVGGPDGTEEVVHLGWRDLAVTIGIDSPEHLLQVSVLTATSLPQNRRRRAFRHCVIVFFFLLLLFL